MAGGAPRCSSWASRRAAPLFYRYGNAARTPQTRAKGLLLAAARSPKAGQGEDRRALFPNMPRNIPTSSMACSRSSGWGGLCPTLPIARHPPHGGGAHRIHGLPAGGRGAELARDGDWPTTNRFQALAEQGRVAEILR